ncbi:hypothetical protein BV22DRAFT_1076559 [Leucogyrophana mollusca]|uniref:Uncharacterized protein n=1 Tax=Leucogyrophana mollusca TaxID=85980 RepID=A0ACB8AY06_9AGAM|nr:hypothetical protein BV22DRAFT_1076559 [Leucogyrophana mollusca]
MDPKSRKLIDGKILRFFDGSTKRVLCTVCPSHRGVRRSMELRFVKKHCETHIHIRHAAYKASGRTGLSQPFPSHPQREMQQQHDLSHSERAVSEPFEDGGNIMDLDCNLPHTESQNGGVDIPDSHTQDTLSPDDTTPAAPIEEYIPLSQLWSAGVNNRTYNIGGGTGDLFEELKAALEAGEELFSTPLAPVDDVCEPDAEDADSASDFGIELSDVPIESSAAKSSAAVSPVSPHYPWASQAQFLTALLFGSARLPFSDAQKKAVLSYAKALGAKNVPSIGAFKKSQEEVSKLVGIPTEKVTAMSGNIFYINGVGSAIAKDYANPLTRFSMQDYPEDEGGGMTQVFSGEKMLLDLPSPPAARVGKIIYFVGELLQESSGGYFIPERFFLASYPSSEAPPLATGEPSSGPVPKELYALGRVVERTDMGFIVHDQQEIIPTSMFQRSFEDISSYKNELDCGLTGTSGIYWRTNSELTTCFLESSKKYARLEPHPLRQKSQGRMVYTVPLIIFMDDVSGNISKQWNKHHAIYMSNANLPREMLEKEFCVRFVTASPHAAPMELMQAMKRSICQAAESGIVTWDCKTNEEVMLVPYGLFVAGDNPMQAEECSHAGLNCNYFCRTCDVGGNKEYKQSSEGYNTIFESGNLRTPDGTAERIKQQFNIALSSGATDKLKQSMASTGVRDTTSSVIVNTLVELGKRLRKRDAGAPAIPESEVKAKLEKEFEDLLNGGSLEDVINPLLGMEGMNIHLDTPTEILHTVLLGVVKYFWGQTVFLLEKSKLLNVLQRRLESIDKTGLNAPCLNADYICHYKGGLIGKHFKSLAQVMPFLIYDLVPKSVLDGWTTIGELVVLIWHTKIDNSETYLNAMNRSTTFSVSHVYTATGKPLAETPATSLHDRIFCFPIPPFSSDSHIHPGTGRFQTTARDNDGKTERDDPVSWAQTRCAAILKTNRPGTDFFQGSSLVTTEGDRSSVEGHVILLSADGTVEHVALQPFAFRPTLHSTLHLPCLELTNEEIVVSAKDITCAVNVQHNCVDSQLRVTNIIQVREAAVRQLRDKKAAKVSEVDDSRPPGPIIAQETASEPAPFDRTANKQKTKRRAVAKNAPKGRGSKTAAVEAPAPPEAGPSHRNLQPIAAGGAIPPTSHPPSQHFPPETRPHGSFTSASSSRPSHVPRNASISALGTPGPSRDFSRPPPSPTGSLDEPISTALGTRHDREPEDPRDPTKLTPRRTKRLKTYANNIAEKRGISKKELNDFVDYGDIYKMLIDLKASLIEKSENQEEGKLDDIKELIESSEFQAALKTRLTACLMSPNITAYVTDTQQHIMVQVSIRWLPQALRVKC